MAVAFRSQTTLASGSRTNSTLTAPSGIQDGDLLLLFLVVNDDPAETPTPPTGFTALTGFPVDMTHGGDTSTTRFNVWRKIASGESGNYTSTHSAGFSEDWLGCYSGVDNTTPISPNPSIEDHATGGTGGGTMTAPSITPTVNDSGIVGLYACWDAVGSQSPSGGTTPTFTERHNPATGGIYVQDGILATAGATGTKSVSSNQADNRPWVAALVCLQAAAGGGGGTTPKNVFGKILSGPFGGAI